MLSIPPICNSNAPVLHYNSLWASLSSFMIQLKILQCYSPSHFSIALLISCQKTKKHPNLVTVSSLGLLDLLFLQSDKPLKIYP